LELSIDTSTSHASIALSDEGSMIDELAWHTAQNHTIELVPNIRHLLERQKTNIREVKALTVAVGPGSFNGLRVGITTAKGLAYVMGVPLVGIGTLEAIAHPYAASGLTICPLLPMGRTEVAAAIFKTQDGVWSKVVAEHITTIESLCSAIAEPIVFCGEIRPEQMAELRAKAGEWASIPQQAAVERARYLAELGWCRIKAGDFNDPSTLQPLYLKKPSITNPTRREHDALSDMRARTQG